MAAIEATASDLENAISQGLAQLKLLRAEVKIEILDEGARGVLGFGARQAKVRLTPITEIEAAAPVAKPVEAAPKAAPVTSSPAKTEPPRAKPAEKAVADEADVLADEAANAPAADETDEADEAGPVADTLALAQELTQGVVDRMGFEASATAQLMPPRDEHDHETIVVDIVGDDVDILLDHHMEGLNALQTVIQSMWSHQTKDSTRISLDANGYKAKREQRIQQMAVRMAEQVVDTGRPVTLEPMSAAERRLVHIALRDNEKVYTESMGEGSSRRVQIKLHK
ncbi:MAG TPA: RNA-binding cell elongation regulator Jag/EloR [Thermoflexales bacterium]|nr:RNA-binding cell elongation regulator Jag/EloR [Thermoflexales bacterium]HQW35007.1 RNA-binding cell elongation regulator Jag/EloR [Thermoflexales bacterium]HQZ21832.1 RNA-binding cell elongation regulator Jag/EloR [Thermoflexales bacterium]HRA00392.1 RNA-binding cell elongation regulator Jag/EloR [Thermoflexales bacterium]